MPSRMLCWASGRSSLFGMQGNKGDDFIAHSGQRTKPRYNHSKESVNIGSSYNIQLYFQVIAFCDVDVKKISRGYYTYEESQVIYCYTSTAVVTGDLYIQELPRPRIPILHFIAAKPPFVICVKWVSGAIRVMHCPKLATAVVYFEFPKGFNRWWIWVQSELSESSRRKGLLPLQLAWWALALEWGQLHVTTCSLGTRPAT